jgi:Kdo2-lipid IVA lauroyltransferase/acyltransferase
LISSFAKANKSRRAGDTADKFMPLRATAERPLWHPFEWPSWLGLAILWCLGKLPFRLNQWAGRSLGFMIAPLLRTRGKVARRNLEVCFPNLSHTEREDLLTRNLRNSGLLISEFAFAWMASDQSLAKVPVRFNNLAGLQAAIAKGKGVLLVGAHFSHLELAGRLMCANVATPVGGMYREHETAAFEQVIKQRRLRYAKAMFRRDELRAAIRWLKAGNILWYAPDQEYRRGDTVFAPFFDIPASTLTATHQLAKMTGAAVVGFAHRRLNNDDQFAGKIGYEISFSEPLTDFPSTDAVADTTRVNDLIVAGIRAAPEQYLWMHQRFKVRPEGSEKIY